MSKDVNIHVKTQGTQQSASELGQVGHAAEEMGSKTARATNWIVEGFKSLIGPLGFAAIATGVATAAGKIAEFFDNIKTRCDESVNRLKEVRKGFQDIFEAMNAFDESSRRQITKGTISLLKETSVSREIGLPVINAYTRQFRGAIESGQITEEQYNQGLKEMLGYAERHGGAATPELITLMAGWGMNKPEQQGKFRRQIGAVSGKSGLTEEEIIAALGRSAPTVKAMGWTPELALENIGIIAAGEIGKKKLSLPATTIESLVNPQVKDIDKTYGISKGAISDPLELLGEVTRKTGQMSQKDSLRMLTDIYGADAATGVYKLITGRRKEMSLAISQAGSPTGMAAEQKEESTSRLTLERQSAKLDAFKVEEDLRRGREDVANQSIRAIGESARTTLRIEQPKMQWYRERFKRDNTTKEEAAYRQWVESLTEGEKKELFDEWVKSSTEPDVKLRPEVYRNAPDPYMKAWREMSPIEQYDVLTTDQRVPSQVNIHYHHDMNYYPSTGDKLTGPRADRDFK